MIDVECRARSPVGALYYGKKDFRGWRSNQYRGCIEYGDADIEVLWFLEVVNRLTILSM